MSLLAVLALGFFAKKAKKNSQPVVVPFCEMHDMPLNSAGKRAGL